MKHAMIRLAETQRKTRTLYCGGLDPHCFGDNGLIIKPEASQERLLANYEANMKIYAWQTGGEPSVTSELYRNYMQLADFGGMTIDMAKKFAGLMTAIEEYIIQVIDVLADCDVKVYKPQS